MAESASTLQLRQQRALEADTFRRLTNRPVDPQVYGANQAERLQTQLDAAQVGTKPVEQEAIERYARQKYSVGDRLKQLRTLRDRARGPQPQAVAAEAANRLYTRYFNIFQSELIANAMALEIIVSPWLFLGLFFMRILTSIIPLRVKGVAIIPPYTFRTGDGIGVFIGHLAAALVICIILFAILFFIMLLVWIITEDPITQASFFIEASGGVFKGLFNLLKAAAS